MKRNKIEVEATDTPVGHKRYRVEEVERGDGTFYEYFMWLVLPRSLKLVTVYGEMPESHFPSHHDWMLNSLWEKAKNMAGVRE